MNQTRIKNILDFIEKELSKMLELENPVRLGNGHSLRFSFSCNPVQYLTIRIIEIWRKGRVEVVEFRPSIGVGWFYQPGRYKIKPDDTINLGWAKKAIREKYTPQMARRGLETEQNKMIQEANELRYKSLATIIENMTSEKWKKDSVSAHACHIKLRSSRINSQFVSSTFSQIPSDNPTFTLHINNLLPSEMVMILKAIAENVED